jgi:hypothetical protein
MGRELNKAAKLMKSLRKSPNRQIAKSPNRQIAQSSNRPIVQSLNSLALYMLKKLSIKIAFIFLTFFAASLPGQDQRVKVFSDQRMEYAFPWAGGMNSCQFGKVDINLDGILDLIVFDRTGDRVMPFLVVQTGDSYEYKFAPEFAGKFPALSHWVIFADYNLDGNADIFTYSPGYAGLKVYRNISATELEFRLEVFPFLTSFQGGGYVNILVTYADYPAICDLDGDGDLDMLTFWGLGSFVEKHTNMSMEKYGHADSLDFVKTEFCWGYFAESEESNDLTLDTCLRCGRGEEEKRGKGEEEKRGKGELRHTGSTFQVLDLNGDGLLDLLLGDVDYPNLVALYNGGSTDTARMVSYDWEFPPYGQPVHLFSMPAAFYDDFDFDGVNDLLVSPFDPNPFLTGNFYSSWFYHNVGSNNQPQFSLQSRSFLQEQMLDFGAGAYPVFYDIDGDGLTDLLVGNYGYYDTSYLDEYLILHTEQTGKIALLKNTGTLTQPAFTLTERDFAGVSALELKGVMPAFGDLDGDGDPDMLLGCENGQIIFYENTANTGEPANFELRNLNFQGIDVGSYSSPQLFDLDKDNLDDLIIGEKGGNLNYYRNTGTLEKPVYTIVTDSLGKINVTDPAVSLDGFSVPHFFRNEAGQTHLLVGSEQGVIYYFTGIDGNLSGKFTLSDTLAGLIGLQDFIADRGYRTSPALFDLDHDGYPELIAGNFSGGLEYFGKSAGSPVSDVSNPFDNTMAGIKVFPNPARDQITITHINGPPEEFADIYLYNSKGELTFLSSGNLNQDIIFNVELLPRGIYFLKLLTTTKGLKFNSLHSFKVILL